MPERADSVAAAKSREQTPARSSQQSESFLAGRAAMIRPWGKILVHAGWWQRRACGGTGARLVMDQRAVDSARSRPRTGSSIAFDAAGRPHIAYTERIDGDLKYAHKNAANVWVIETVDSAGLVGSGVSLALDASGMAHVSYQRNNDSVSMGDVRHAERHCFFADFWCSWTVTTLATGVHSPFSSATRRSPSITAANIHVTFVDHASGQLRYTKRDSSGWWTRLAVTPFSFGTTSDRRRRQRLAHLAFADQGAGTQLCAHRLRLHSVRLEL